jgi:hypothetical protein
MKPLYVNFKSTCQGEMSRRGPGKSDLATRGEADRKTPAANATAGRELVPVQPRRGNRRLLAASALLFLLWLAVLAWLASV